MSDSVWPHRRQPTRLPRPWDSPGKNTGVGCHVLLQCMKVKSESEVAQSCPTPSNLMDCSLPGSSVHGIFQARVLEWGAIAFSLSTPPVKHQNRVVPNHNTFFEIYWFSKLWEILVRCLHICSSKWSLMKMTNHSYCAEGFICISFTLRHGWGSHSCLNVSPWNCMSGKTGQIRKRPIDGFTGSWFLKMKVYLTYNIVLISRVQHWFSFSFIYSSGFLPHCLVGIKI